MFNKFFGKKNDGFYMEAKDTTPPKADAPKAVAAKTTIIVEEPVKAATADVVAEPTEKKAASTKTSIKKDKKQDGTSVKAEAVAPAPATVASVTVAPAAVFTNFATDYLVTPSVAGNRRRPGANMKGFMSMARDVKEMKKGSQANQQKQKAAKRTEA
jgi:hypothetical protein